MEPDPALVAPSEEVGLAKGLPTEAAERRPAFASMVKIMIGKQEVWRVNIRPRWPQVPEGQERPKLEKEQISAILHTASDEAVRMVVMKTAQDIPVMFWCADPSEAYMHAVDRLIREFRLPVKMVGIMRNENRLVMAVFTRTGEATLDYLGSLLQGIDLPERRRRPKRRDGKPSDSGGDEARAQ